MSRSLRESCSHVDITDNDIHLDGYDIFEDDHFSGLEVEEAVSRRLSVACATNLIRIFTPKIGCTSIRCKSPDLSSLLHTIFVNIYIASENQAPDFRKFTDELYNHSITHIDHSLCVMDLILTSHPPLVTSKLSSFLHISMLFLI